MTSLILNVLCGLYWGAVGGRNGWGMGKVIAVAFLNGVLISLACMSLNLP